METAYIVLIILSSFTLLFFVVVIFALVKYLQRLKYDSNYLGPVNPTSLQV